MQLVHPNLAADAESRLVQYESVHLSVAPKLGTTSSVHSPQSISSVASCE